MKKIIAAYLVALIFAVGCQPSLASIQTAIAQTQSAGTPIPTQTAQIVAVSPSSTFTPAASIMPSSTVISAEPTRISAQDGMTLLYVPAGNFLMGSTDADPLAKPKEKPQHTVYVNAFWIDQTDVTNAMYTKCAQGGVCQPPSDLSSATHPSYYGNSKYDNYPVIDVSWDDAAAYCKWAGRRLPTEAEWEKAARGTDGRFWPWGNDDAEPPISDILIVDFFVDDTTAVGIYPHGASPYGALDMAGNVEQWVNDWYSATYYQSSPSANPPGPDSGVLRVVRGSGYQLLNQYPFRSGIDIRSGIRSAWDPSVTFPFLGFRCATLSP
jgi:eukaryotic-like serine/threonine-protein kinase